MYIVGITILIMDLSELHTLKYWDNFYFIWKAIYRDIARC